MARRERRKLDASADEEGVGSNEECLGPVAHDGGEGHIDLAAGAGVDDLNLQSETECSFGYLSQRGLGIRRIGRIDQHGNSNRFGHQVVQEPQPLGHKFSEENIDAGHIASRPSKAGDQPQPDGVFADEEDNRVVVVAALAASAAALTSVAITAHTSADEVGHERR